MTKMSSMRADGSVPKRRRQDVQKVVVSLKDYKFEQGPPADSWSWRKYGQKPIKGSPHPRGYYKCSSYRGCPARKQVDKCRNDASLLIITYISDHNHDNNYVTNSVQEQTHHSASSDAGAALSNGMSLAEVTVSSSKLSNEESCDFFDELEELTNTTSFCISLAKLVFHGPRERAASLMQEHCYREKLMTHKCFSLRTNYFTSFFVIVMHVSSVYLSGS